MSARHKPGAAPLVFELRSASMTLVVLALKTTDMAAIERALVERFAATPGMFDHDPVVIDVAQAEGDPAAIDWPELAALMWRFDMVAAAVRGGTPEQMAAAFSAGLGLAPEVAAPAPRAPASAAGTAPAALVQASAGQPVAEPRPRPRADGTASTAADMPVTPAGGIVSGAAAVPAASTAAVAAVPPTTAGVSAASTTAGAPAASTTASAPATSSATAALTAGYAAASPAPPPGSPEPAAPAPAASTALTGPADALADPPTAAPATVAATLVVDRPLRSGQQVYARGGDLVVLAAVNFGAEVIADGSIHVYAPLRGKAVAGAKGDRTARIFSICMEPQLIAVAGTYRTTDSPLPANVIGKPAQIRLDGERLVFEPLG